MLADSVVLSGILSQENVFEYEQYEQHIHNRVQLFSFSCENVHYHIRDYTECDTLDKYRLQRVSRG